MKRFLRILPFLPALAALYALTPAISHAQNVDEALKLMTFNIRYGTAEDGANAWEHRREWVAELIDREAPDVLAIQEALSFQLDELAPALADYRKLGQHRDGGLEGEYSGVYVKEERVRVLDWGELWLSPTPEVVASVGWDAALTRMAVWADLEWATGRARMRVFGTHFDHRGVQAREESARLLLRHARDAPPTAIMGDLNVPEDSDALRAILQEGYRSAFTTLHPGSQQGTFNGFRDPRGGDRIDHILLGPGLKPLEAAILTETAGDIWISDHFPVTALVILDPALKR